MAHRSFPVTVVCAEPDLQSAITLEVKEGCTAGEALALAGIFDRHPGIDPAACGIGIFGREVGADHALAPGDRVEVLRPLPESPRERRRRLAREGRSIGGSARRR